MESPIIKVCHSPGQEGSEAQSVPWWTRADVIGTEDPAVEEVPMWPLAASLREVTLPDSS